MTKETEELIYAIKKNKYNDNSLKNVAISHFSHIYGISRDCYYDEHVFDMVKEAFIDYLNTADSVQSELYNYFEAQRSEILRHKDIDVINLEIHCMLVVFLLAQIKNKDGKYVNGFGVLSE